MNQWDRSPRTLVVTLLAGVLLLVAVYRIVFPLVVRTAAGSVPNAALEAIGGQVLASLDESLLQPTTLPAGEQQAIHAAFGRLALPPDLAGRVRLEFRKSGELGANALALPSGTMIVTDDLVGLATDADDVVAVLAHEVGHLEGRHSVRAIVQDALVSTLIMLVIGDVSALAAAAPAALLEARYSRDLEREADAYAVGSLRRLGIAPTRLADMLERMEAAHAKAGHQSSGGALAYLSTHPTTEERLQTLRGGS
jgi:Zn-dependent protease with chaperone function